jgi:hypothetical protein
MKQLEADPEWIARRAARARDIASREAQSRREQASLLSDLAAFGVVVANVWDLVNTAAPYPRALPILLAHFSRDYSEHLLEGIARALAVKPARLTAWDPFLTALHAGTLPKNVTDAVMVAISVMARPADLPVLIDLIADRSLGGSRLFLVSNLTRSRRLEARETLSTLRDDPELQSEIAARLK